MPDHRFDAGVLPNATLSGTSSSPAAAAGCVELQVTRLSVKKQKKKNKTYNKMKKNKM
ncbi:hypothetical protein ACFFJ7_18855 [Pseudochelatococcus lubricantis]|uniref:hypothetical protein n=1 Tax=Pseudochelatococcus lubricantis TaxID=1538102 RepID=UPI0035E9F7EB